jgi:hypothetical protein
MAIRVKKAFNVCSHDILLRKLPKYGITGKSWSWFTNYLKDWIPIVDINGSLSDEKLFSLALYRRAY